MKEELVYGGHWRFTGRRPRARPVVSGENRVSEQTWKYLSREIPAQEPNLDQDVWKRSLPDDVFCTILARLPLSSLSRLRTVCKRWYCMVNDPNFLEACSRLQTRQPSLVFQNDEGCSMYEPGTDNWLPIPTSFFQPKSGNYYKVVDSRRGRILLLRRHHLMLFNPLNQSEKNLPPMLDMDQTDLPSMSDIHIIGMYVDDMAKCFSIFVLDKKTNPEVHDEDDNQIDDEPFLSQVYDSESNSWSMRGSFHPEYELSVENASLFKGTIHCLTKATQAHVHYNQLAIYSVLEDMWDEEAINMPAEDREFVSPHLFTYRGKQMLVAALPTRTWTEGVFQVWKNIIIWELTTLRLPDRQWVRMFEIHQTEVEEELWNIHPADFIFLCEGDFVYFGSKTASTLAMINLEAQTWRVLPNCPEYTPYDGRSLGSTSFLFEPRFDLVV